MNTKRISAALAIVAIATLITVTSPQPNVLAGGSSAPQLEGSWEVTITPDSGPSFISLATFSPGGGMVVVNPNQNTSTGHGNWVKTGGKNFAVTFVYILRDPAGNDIGTVKVRAAVHFDPQADTFSGPQQVMVTIGGNVVASFCGTVQGERISVEPPEPCA